MDDSTTTVSTPKRMWRRFRGLPMPVQIIGWVVLAIVAIAAGSGGEDAEPVAADTEAAAEEEPAEPEPAAEEPEPEPVVEDEPEPEPEGPEADASARLACGHFRNVAGDVQAGILSDAELREKLKEVYDDAWVSEDPGIAEHAEGMLAAITAGDVDAMSEHIAGFDAACRAVGV